MVAHGATMKKVISVLVMPFLCVALGLLTAAPASAHTITCTGSTTRAWPSGTQVWVQGSTSCTDSPDIATTTVRVQIYLNGKWGDWGGGTTTGSTQENLILQAHTGMKIGCYHYRGRTHKE